MEFLIYGVCGAVAGVLAGLFGVGGGLVIVPVLVSVFTWQSLGSGFVMQLALGTSLTTIIATSASSTWSHHRRGSVRWDLFIRLAPGIVLGTWLGAGLADVSNSEGLRVGFGIAECALGIYLWFKRPAAERAAPETNWNWQNSSAVGGVIGVISALAGIGGGTLTVPYLLRGGLLMNRAVATSAACGLPIAVSGSLSYVVWGWGEVGLPAAATGYVYWPAALGIVSFSVLCAPFGAYLAHRLPEKILKKAFAALLILLGLKMLLA
ncbi:MAG: sulfite exporter TauE/SafE family protein [Oceanococcus sp.]